MTRRLALLVISAKLGKLDCKVNAADILTESSTPPDGFSDLRVRRRTMGQALTYWALSACVSLRRSRGGDECLHC